MAEIIVFVSQTQAARFSSDVDTDMGYPRPGLPMGAALPGVGTTTQFAPVIQNRARSKFGYTDLQTVKGLRARVPLPAGAVVEQDDGGWAL